jgi:hypothetical protein
LAILGCLLQLSLSVCSGTAVVVCLAEEDHVVIELALAGGLRCSDETVRDRCLQRDGGDDCDDLPLLLPAQAAAGTGSASRVRLVAAVIPVAVAWLPPARPLASLSGRGPAPPAPNASPTLASVRLLV